MGIFRDLLAIMGSIGMGWVVFSWHRYTEKGATMGVTLSIVLLVVVIMSILSAQNRVNRLMRENDKVTMRNLYLEAAIKQGGEPKV